MFSRIGAGEEPGVLEHHAEPAAQRAPLRLPEIDAVDPNRAAVDVVEAHQQVHERRLAGTGRTDDRDHLSRRDVERQVLDHRHALLVAESHRIELYGAVRRSDRLG